MELRPTTDGDLPALHAIFIDAIGSVFVPHGFDPPSPSLATFANLQGHIRRTGTSVVAIEGEQVVAYGSSWTRGDDWFLASLFVGPAAQGHGVGSALLEAVWTEAKRRRTMTDAIQPVSNTLYGRRGLVPVTPVLTFYGRPQIDATGEHHPADTARIDELAYGFDREVDHRHWTQHARELAAANGEVRVRVPGSARSLVEVALAARLRLAPVPGLLLVSRGVEPPTALAPSSYALY